MLKSKILLVLFTVALHSRVICAFSIVLGPADNRTQRCLERKCIPKCCESGKYLNDTESAICVDYAETYNFDNVTVYDKYAHDRKIDKTLRDLFYLVPGKIYDVLEENNYTFADSGPFVASTIGLNTYLSENGELYLEVVNAYERWVPVKYFCIDYVIDEDITEPLYLIVFVPDPEDPETKTQSHFVYYLAISSVFLVMVLLVYIILPELRNLGGMILMAYVTSLLVAFSLLVTLQLVNFPEKRCIHITAAVYFSFLTTFCWMNVMSVDIWWTFRGYAKARPIHRRGENFKFCMYCIYAFGLPGAMTAMLVAINETDFSQMPWIVTPRIPKGGCFIQGGQKLLYLYIPMLILIFCNWIFFLMTAYNIRRLMRGTAVLNTAAAGNPAAHQQQRNRLMVYLKLSVIMGINWLLEVVSSFSPKLKIWEFSDAYNLLMGLAIFLIFVCKKKIYRRLIERYYDLRSKCFGGKRPTRTLTKSSTTSSTMESNLSQEIPLQVSNNPMPNEKRERKNCAVFKF